MMGRELSSLLGGIRQATAGGLEGGEAATDTTRLAEVLTHLETLLRQGDMAAGDLARKETALLRAALGDAAESLLRRIDAFDFDNAAVQLHEYRARSRVAAPGAKFLAA
jgi:hypothetical protein